MNVSNSTSPNFQALRIQMRDHHQKRVFIESATPAIRENLAKASEALKNTKFVDVVMNASKRGTVFFEPVISLKENTAISYGNLNDKDYCFRNTNTGYYKFKGTDDCLEYFGDDSNKRSLYRVNQELHEDIIGKDSQGRFKQYSMQDFLKLYTGDILPCMVKLALRIEKGIATENERLSIEKTMQKKNEAENKALLNSLIDDADVF